MRLSVLAHRDPYSDPRGGERSVTMIAERLSRTMDVRVTADRALFPNYVKTSDILVTWATAAPQAAEWCMVYDKPYILMVRWWRLIQPLPPGDLLNRPIDMDFTRRHQYIFDNAAHIVTNNNWSRSVISRYYDLDSEAVYVPAPEGGIKSPGAKHSGPVVLVTPHKDLGEERLIRKLSSLMPEETFWLVNSEDDYGLPNVVHTGYERDMSSVYRKAKIVIYPIYDNDVCGTSRVFIEAAQYGVPTLANDRCGFCEKGAVKLPPDATPHEWAGAIRYVSENLTRYTKISWLAYRAYGDQIARFEEIVREVVR